MRGRSMLLALTLQNAERLNLKMGRVPTNNTCH
jgi:hypothetical protein